MRLQCYHRHMLNVTFAEITAELRGIEPQLDAAEVHGCLCGELCTVKNLSAQQWLRDLVAIEPEVEDSEVLQQLAPQPIPSNPALEQLFTESRDALQSDTMEFALLLPDDDTPLALRVAAMAQWVAGFLYGYGVGAAQLDEVPEAVSEALQDFTQIARANPDEVMETEEDESAYAELIEYLRAAVQVLHDELAVWRATQVIPPAAGLLN